MRANFVMRGARPVGGEWQERAKPALPQMPARIPGIDGGYGKNLQNAVSFCCAPSHPICGVENLSPEKIPAIIEYAIEITGRYYED